VDLNVAAGPQSSMKKASKALSMLGMAAAFVFLAVVFYVYALQIASHEDYRNSNFSKFWIAGHMVLAGQNPYDPTQWHMEQIQLGSTWTPDQIFLYPLPQAFFLTPLALLPAASSFIVWDFASQVIIAITCFILLISNSSSAQKRLFLPIVIFLLFFGPTYLSLQVGSIGAIALLVSLAAILLLERKDSFLAGVLLSILVLKPSQGLPILLLVALWLLRRRDVKAITGMVVGGLLLLLSGLIYDPMWIGKFISNSQDVSSRTLGLQSNIYSFAFLACNKNSGCMWIVGSGVTLLVLLLGALYLWRNGPRLTAWEAFNVIIPLGFVATIYLWSYDQLLYIIPIVWIAMKSVEATKFYILAFLFLLILDVLSLFALAVQANTHQDLLSIISTVFILGLCLMLLHVKDQQAVRVGNPS
jgi:hypothetical protein